MSPNSRKPVILTEKRKRPHSPYETTQDHAILCFSKEGSMAHDIHSTRLYCAESLSKWIAENSTPEDCKRIADSIGYNYSPILGRTKQRNRILFEVIIVNTILAMYATNETSDEIYTKLIIDGFLEVLRISIFDIMAEKDSSFSEIYTARMYNYRQCFEGGFPIVCITDEFMRHLNVDRKNPIMSELALIAEFSAFFKGATDVFRDEKIARAKAKREMDPVLDFVNDIASWPDEERAMAFQMAIDVLDDKERADYGLHAEKSKRVEELVDLIYEKSDVFDDEDVIHKSYRRLEKYLSQNIRPKVADTSKNDDGVLDAIEKAAEIYHQQIDDLVDKNYRFLQANFKESTAKEFSLRTVAVFITHVATLAAINRDCPWLHRSRINGLTLSLSHRTPHTMPTVKATPEVFVSYCSVEESFMQNQIGTFEQNGLDPLVENILSLLGGGPKQYDLIRERIEHASFIASRTYLPHLSTV
jgi:hypothetical protein